MEAHPAEVAKRVQEYEIENVDRGALAADAGDAGKQVTEAS